MNFVEIMVLILFPITIIGFSYFAYRKYQKAQQDKYNLVNFLFFSIAILAMLINLFYILLQNWIPDSIYMFLSRLVGMLLASSLIFPPYFLLAVKKSFKTITLSLKITYFGISATLLIGFLFLGDVSLNTDHTNIYSYFLGFYEIGVIFLFFIFFLCLAIPILNQFTTPILRKKLLSYLIGYTICAILMILAIFGVMNLINPKLVAYFYSIGLLPGGWLFYNGVDRSIKEE